MQDTDGFGREAFVGCAYNFKVREVAVLLHHETDDDAPLHAVCHSGLRVVHLESDMPVQGINVTPIAGKYLWNSFKDGRVLRQLENLLDDTTHGAARTNNCSHTNTCGQSNKGENEQMPKCNKMTAQVFAKTLAHVANRFADVGDCPRASAISSTVNPSS